jgi:hypothetical protein
MKDNVLIGIEWEPQFTLLKWPTYPVYIKNTKKRIGSVIPQYFNADGYISKSSYQRVSVEVPASYGVWRSTNAAYNNWNRKNPYRYMSIDGTNFEIITKPVKIEKLSSEIKKADKHLKEFCGKLFKLTGPLGVFLPNWEFGYGVPSKHVNISLDDMLLLPKSDNKFLKSLIGFKDRGFVSKIDLKGECHTHQSRVHITVPYNFDDYDGLLDFFQKTKINKSDIMFYLYQWSIKHPMPFMSNTDKKGIFLGHFSKKEYIKVNGLL